MILNHINHKMPIYKDCTLFELLVTSVAWLVIVGTLLSLLTWLFFGYALIGLTISIFSLVHAVRFLLGRLQKIKYGKPYGYYQQLFLKKLNEIGMIALFWQSHRVVRLGKWSVRRGWHEN